MELTTDALLTPMLEALEPFFGGEWSKVRVYAETEAFKMAQTLVVVASLRAARQINDDQVNGLIDMQRQFAQAVLLTVEGVGLTTALHAVNLLLGAVKDRFNGALSLCLL